MQHNVAQINGHPFTTFVSFDAWHKTLSISLQFVQFSHKSGGCFGVAWPTCGHHTQVIGPFKACVYGAHKYILAIIELEHVNQFVDIIDTSYTAYRPFNRREGKKNDNKNVDIEQIVVERIRAGEPGQLDDDDRLLRRTYIRD